MAESKEISEKIYKWNKEKITTDNKLTNSTEDNEKTATDNQWISTNKNNK